MAVRRGQRALAHELVGVSRRCSAGREHALERGPVRPPHRRVPGRAHRLAETLVAIEGANDAAPAAGATATPLTAAVAKAIAGRGPDVARQAQQVLAGIGFTTEHPFHHHLRRALVLDRLFGDSRSLTARSARTCSATGDCRACYRCSWGVEQADGGQQGGARHDRRAEPDGQSGVQAARGSVRRKSLVNDSSWSLHVTGTRT